MGLIPRIVMLVGGLVGGLTILAGFLVAAAVKNYIYESGHRGARRAVAEAEREYFGANVDSASIVVTRDQGGRVYRAPKRDGGRRPEPIFIPDELMRGLATSSAAAILVASISLALLTFGVAYFVAIRVTAPLNRIIDDVTEISRGKLEHQVQVTAGGEIATLARAVSRMVADLLEKRGTEEELERREHDAQVAVEIRQNLIPDSLPQLDGYEIGGTDLEAAEPGGDYFDVIEFPDSDRIGFLVSEISGSGVPAAMVMAMARAYLRSEALQGGEPTEVLSRANRLIKHDIRRGMYVTAIYALLEPARSRLMLASAGHKMPLLRWSHGERKLQISQPEGIALGFDEGPVFERTIRQVEFDVEPGDRIMLTTTGATMVKNEEGEELSEKGLYRLVAQHAPKNTDAFLQLILGSIHRFSGGAGLAKNIVLVTMRRDA